MTIRVTQQSAVPGIRIAQKDLRIQRILRLQSRRCWLAGLGVQITKELHPTGTGATDTMNRNPGILQAIQALLLKPLIKRGVTQLQPEITTVEVKAAAAVSDGDRCHGPW